MEKTTDHLELILRYFDDFSPRQLEQLTALSALYQDWNNKINVISRKDIDSLYEKHVLHSLSIAAAFQFEKDMQVVDIGTGGGFPGIPLAIFFPDTAFHLVDSIGKKIKVVEAVRDAIGLTNVTTRHGRAEEIKDRKFDVAVSRAVAPLKDLQTWSKPLLKKPSRRPAPSANPSASHPGIAGAAGPDSSEGLPIPHGLICLKGGDLAAEIAESHTRPRVMEIHDIFALDYFREKYLLYVPS
ncbi:MAG TPA: 16S rRNA (guanine(527)-N(7))-methyltransferase RsmG [Puia sp.]|nr:16S rRNA (guanine(527)-N(7))-methyltransferase RsmG [Puia sp.]